jgi:hypothetical protein
VKIYRPKEQTIYFFAIIERKLFRCNKYILGLTLEKGHGGEHLRDEVLQGLLPKS